MTLCVMQFIEKRAQGELGSDWENIWLKQKVKVLGPPVSREGRKSISDKSPPSYVHGLAL